jgi:hypothetical protein
MLVIPFDEEGVSKQGANCSLAGLLSLDFSEMSTFQPFSLTGVAEKEGTIQPLALGKRRKCQPVVVKCQEALTVIRPSTPVQ